LTFSKRAGGRAEAVGACAAEGAEPDETMGRWLARCRQLAGSDLEGIEAPADELAELAAGDREMMERAYRHLVQALEDAPRDKTLRQMLAFWRRAFEKGDWPWQDNPWDGNPLLS
jgi:hypothetical protein